MLNAPNAVVSASPISAASFSTSALKSVFATIASVSLIISSCTSSERPSVHRDRVRSAYSTIDLPQAEMKLTLAGEKPFPQDTLGAYECAALGEILLVRDEHVADEIRVVEQVDALVADLEEHNVAILF